MPEVIERELQAERPQTLDTALQRVDERAARADLRRQIAVLEMSLAQLFEAAFPLRRMDFTVPAPAGGPRMLSLGELERVRDSLAARTKDVRGRLDDHAYLDEQHRLLIEEMSADPEAHKWVRVSNADIGEPGCRHWHSRPRWGLLGMVIGWWRVVVSSGCPLAEGLAAPAEI